MHDHTTHVLLLLLLWLVDGCQSVPGHATNKHAVRDKKLGTRIAPMIASVGNNGFCSAIESVDSPVTIRLPAVVDRALLTLRNCDVRK